MEIGFSSTTEFADVWVQENPPVIYTKIILPPSSDELFRSFRQRFLHLAGTVAKKNGGSFYSIFDATSLQFFTFDLLMSCIETIGCQVTDELRICAVVRSKSLEKVNTSIAADVTYIEVFDNMSEAKGCINSDWSRLLKKNQI